MQNEYSFEDHCVQKGSEGVLSVSVSIQDNPWQMTQP